MKFDKIIIQNNVSSALTEDIGTGDVSADLLNNDLLASGTIICRQRAILAGVPWVNEVLRQAKFDGKWCWLKKDGDVLQNNDILCQFKGNAKILLQIERVMLNFLQTLSGVATITKTYVDKIAHTNCQVLDTRKTIPNLRYAQKYAVKIGGGFNHRFGLFDAVLIKENHLLSVDSLTSIVTKAKNKFNDKMIEVEVENLSQFKQALRAKPDRILLDNFLIPDLKKAVAMPHFGIELEASGDINIHNINQFANTGVDYISLGCLTKNISAVDLSMRFEYSSRP
ncbi:MAG: carboxylating nicotinate-nucleotide diphosphorylase [Gammaproteobacteria bacterium]|nr:MAG: carboxylating nicotinate-nucleotide diphosphorylase [Gammaproteobacteria bacterium]